MCEQVSCPAKAESRDWHFRAPQGRGIKPLLQRAIGAVAGKR
jgi:hypothetical protein